MSAQHLTASTPPATRWPAWVLAVGVVAAAAAFGTAIGEHPAMLHDRQAGLWLAMLAFVGGGYVVAVLVALLRPASPALRSGVWFGLAAGVAWLGEIWFQAPAGLPSSLERPVAGACALAAAAITVAGGVTEGARTSSGRRALLAGGWTGLVSGTVMAAGLIAIQLSNLGLLGARADYQAELARSGYPDMAAYLASDAVAGSLMHMVLNVLVGLAGAGIGALVALAVRAADRPTT